MATTPAPLSEIGSAGHGSGWWFSLDNEHVPELRWPLSIDVYDRMRRGDAQVISALLAVKLPIERTQWRVEPNGSRPEVYGPLADDLGLPVVGADPKPMRRTRDRFSWAEHLRHALLKLDFGHSVFEQVYRLDETTGLFRLRKFAPRLPRSIAAWDVAADGGLVAVQQWNADRPIPVDRLVVYTHNREGGAWYGQSLLRPAWKSWFLKDPTLKVWVQTIERNGMGVAVYEGAEGEEDLSKGLTIAKGLRSGANAGAATPHGAKLRLAGVEGDLPDAEPAVRYFDEQIARAVLAHFLNLGTQTGSWALGSTFADFFVQSLQAVAESIADTATQHIVEDWVDINFGTDEPAPRIVFDEIGTQQTATAQALKLLVDAGLIFPDRTLEESLRQSFSLPAKNQPTPAPAPVEASLEKIEAAPLPEIHVHLEQPATSAAEPIPLPVATVRRIERDDNGDIVRIIEEPAP